MTEGIWSLLLMNQYENYENCFVFGLENSREQKKRHGRRHLYYRTTSTGLVYGCLDAMPEHAFDTARSRVQRLVLAVGRVLSFRNSEAQSRTTESHNF